MGARPSTPTKSSPNKIWLKLVETNKKTKRRKRNERETMFRLAPPRSLRAFGRRTFSNFDQPTMELYWKNSILGADLDSAAELAKKTKFKSTLGSTRQRRTKIGATIGPASSSNEMLEQLLLRGLLALFLFISSFFVRHRLFSSQLTIFSTGRGCKTSFSHSNNFKKKWETCCHSWGSCRSQNPPLQSNLGWCP